MKSKSFIYGITDLAQLLYANINDCGASIINGFVVDDAYKKEDFFMGLPVTPVGLLHTVFPPEIYGCYIGVGYSRMNENRKDIYLRMKMLGYTILEFIHPDASVNAENLGEGNIFFSGSSVDYYSTLGVCNIFYPGASLAHHSSIGDFNFFAVASCVAGHVHMGNNNFIGANATVINDLHLGNHCLVGAGACLTRSMESGQVFAPVKGDIIKDKSSFDFL